MGRVQRRLGASSRYRQCRPTILLDGSWTAVGNAVRFGNSRYWLETSPQLPANHRIINLIIIMEYRKVEPDDYPIYHPMRSEEARATELALTLMVIFALAAVVLWAMHMHLVQFN